MEDKALQMTSDIVEGGSPVGETVGQVLRNREIVRNYSKMQAKQTVRRKIEEIIKQVY